MSPSLLALSNFFHLAATVVWIGGLVTMVIFVLPAARRALDEQPSLYRLLARIRKRFVPLSNLSLAVLIVTGLFQMTASPFYTGLFQFDTPWSAAMLIKHITIVGMVIVGAVMQWGTTPALERALLLSQRGKGDSTELARLHRNEARLTWVNVVLAVGVLACTAVVTAL